MAQPSIKKTKFSFEKNILTNYSSLCIVVSKSYNIGANKHYSPGNNFRVNSIYKFQIDNFL